MPDIILLPSATGTRTELQPSPALIDNWKAVSHYPDEIVRDTYVFSFRDFAVDLYTLQTLSAIPSIKINFIYINLVAVVKTYEYKGSVAGVIYVPPLDYFADADDLVVLENEFSYVWALNPADNERWELSDIVNIEAGLKLDAKTPATIAPVDCTIDTTLNLLFLSWTNTGMEIAHYSYSGVFKYLSFLKLADFVTAAPDDVLNFAFVLSYAGGVYCYSYDSSGNTALISNAFFFGTYVDLVVFSDFRVVITAGGANGLESYLYTEDGILTFAVDFALEHSLKVEMDFDIHVVFCIAHSGNRIESFDIDAAGIFTDIENFALLARPYDLSVDETNRIIFIVSGAAGLRSLTYDNIGDMTTADTITTGLTDARGVSVDSALMLVFVSEFSTNEIVTFSYNAAGDLTHIPGTIVGNTPTLSCIDTVSRLFFWAATSSGSFRSCSYSIAGALSAADDHSSPASPECYQLYLGINFSYEGEIITNFDEVASDEIHVDQDYSIVAREEMGRSLFGCTNPKILYKNPEGITGELEALVVDQDKLLATMPAVINSLAGKWRFIFYCVLPGGEILEGIPFFTNVQKRWDLLRP